MNYGKGTWKPTPELIVAMRIVGKTTFGVVEFVKALQDKGLITEAEAAKVQITDALSQWEQHSSTVHMDRIRTQWEAFMVQGRSAVLKAACRDAGGGSLVPVSSAHTDGLRPVSLLKPTVAGDCIHEPAVPTTSLAYLYSHRYPPIIMSQPLTVVWLVLSRTQIEGPWDLLVGRCISCLYGVTFVLLRDLKGEAHCVVLQPGESLLGLGYSFAVFKHQVGDYHSGACPVAYGICCCPPAQLLLFRLHTGYAKSVTHLSECIRQVFVYERPGNGREETALLPTVRLISTIWGKQPAGAASVSASHHDWVQAMHVLDLQKVAAPRRNGSSRKRLCVQATMPAEAAGAAAQARADLASSPFTHRHVQADVEAEHDNIVSNQGQ